MNSCKILSLLKKNVFLTIICSVLFMPVSAHSDVVDMLINAFSGDSQYIDDDYSSHSLDKNTSKLLTRINNAIEHYQSIDSSGGWSTINTDSAMKLGDISPSVRSLILRLKITNDLNNHNCLNNKKPSCRFDEKVQKAVKNFQFRHGLKADGAVGKKTLSELNIPIERRLQQLELNKHRLTQFFGLIDDEYVYVNIPEFRLRYIHEGKVLLKNKVVVGKPSWETPSMSDQIEKFVINPTWKIPRSIASQEIVPKVAEDPNYLEESNIEIRKNSYVDTEIVDPNDIDWDEVTPKDFDYFLVKKAGEENPLGEVKYLFPNPDAIYVHDTPAKHWFDRTKRAASHGCIRMEDPFSLAHALANQRSEKDLLKQVEEARLSNETTTFHLDKPVPIHLVYWTAWVDEKQRVNFRNDIYSRDDQEYAVFIEQENSYSEKSSSEALNISTGLSSS